VACVTEASNGLTAAGTAPDFLPSADKAPDSLIKAFPEKENSHQYTDKSRFLRGIKKEEVNGRREEDG